jgi:uncharacterized protein YjbI with pentapeptide repeats
MAKEIKRDAARMEQGYFRSLPTTRAKNARTKDWSYTCLMPAVSTFKELLARYAEGEHNFIGSELDTDPDDDLSGLCLDGVDLSRSFIVATFRGSSLRGAKFGNANVKTCDFTEADLSGADFSGAALCAATFSGACMTGARFQGAFYHSYVFKAEEFPS